MKAATAALRVVKRAMVATTASAAVNICVEATAIASKAARRAARASARAGRRGGSIMEAGGGGLEAVGQDRKLGSEEIAFTEGN